MEPRKFTVEELLEDASLSQMNTTEGSEDWNTWSSIIDFLLEYKRSEEDSEFLWANQISHIDKEDNVEWDTNMKTDDAN